jgi:uncharacterized protein
LRVFEWDEHKSRWNREHRGFDFLFASRIFSGDFVEQRDERRDYGETRMIAIGTVENLLLTVVYTWRGDRRRIISARIADRKERHDYRQATGRD